MTTDAYHFLCAVLAGTDLPAPPTSPQEWESLLTSARQHGIAPFAASKLLASPRITLDVPAAVQAQMQTILRSAAAHSLQVDRILSQLSPSLAQAGIPVFFLKGTYFRTLYPNPALRMLEDIDLLSRRDHLELASQVITAAGYHRLQPLRRQDDLWMATDHHHVFRPTQPGSPAIELHWNLGGNDGEWRTPPLEWFWEQVVPLPLPGGGSLPTLSPTAHLLHQAAHQFLQHPDRIRLKWLYDLHLLLTQPHQQIDWEQAVERAAQYKWSHALALALASIQASFHTPLPADILPRLQRDADPRSIAFIAQATNLQRTATQRALDFLDNLPPAARLRQFQAMIFPSRKYLLWRYNPQPAWLVWLWYPYRWASMAFDLVRTAWSAFRNAKKN
jgi:hypothetical protein